MKCLQCDKIACKRGYCNSCYTVLLRNGSISRKFRNDIIITNLQKEFITGCLLGDGWLSNLKYGRKSPCFGIDRKQEDLDYLKWQYDFVHNLCSRKILLKDRLNKITNKTQKHCLFETRYLPCLLEYRKLWYPNEIKIVPPSLKLTKLIMQIWYCDDGELDIFSSGNFRMRFSTHGFTKDENMFLIDLLKNRYCSNFSLHKDGDKYRICANSKTAPIVLEDLKEGFPPGMGRKMIL